MLVKLILEENNITKLEDELISLKSRYNRSDDYIMKGTVSEESSKIEKNRINLYFLFYTQIRRFYGG